MLPRPITEELGYKLDQKQRTIRRNYKQGFGYNGPKCGRRHVRRTPEECPVEASFGASGAVDGGSKKLKTAQPNDNFKSPDLRSLAISKRRESLGCIDAHGVRDAPHPCANTRIPCSAWSNTCGERPTNTPVMPSLNWAMVRKDKRNERSHCTGNSALIAGPTWGMGGIILIIRRNYRARNIKLPTGWMPVNTTFAPEWIERAALVPNDKVKFTH
eukprot:gene11202-13041_t